MSKRCVLALVTVLAITVFLTAPPQQSSSAEATPDAGTAHVRAIHAVPFGPHVDVHIDGTPTFTDVAYMDVTSYALLSEGLHTVTLYLAGIPLPPLFSATVTLTAGLDYSFAANGPPTAVTATVFLDDNRAPEPGHARVRFVHLAPGTPPVDVGIADGARIFYGVAFREASGYESLEARTLTLTVYLSGTNTPVLTLPDVTFPGGAVRSIFLMGLAAGRQGLVGVVSTDMQYTYVFLPMVMRDFTP